MYAIQIYCVSVSLVFEESGGHLLWVLYQRPP